MIINDTEIDEKPVILRGEVQGTGRMQTGLAYELPLVAQAITSIKRIIKRGESLDDELPLVGEGQADIPRMILSEKMPFHVEQNVHRLENRALSPIFTQWNLSDVTVAEAELEVPVSVSPAQIKQGVDG